MNKKIPSIVELLDYLDYYHSSFHPYDGSEDIIVQKLHNKDWEIGIRGQEVEFDEQHAQVVFNRHKLDLMKVHKSLYRKVLEKAALSKMKYEDGIALCGQEPVEEAYEGWKNFGKILGDKIKEILEDQDKEKEKQEKRKNFSIVKDEE